MGPKSELWKYYTKLSKETVKCNICFKTLKTCGNTSNLHAHMKQKHSSMYKKGTKQPSLNEPKQFSNSELESELESSASSMSVSEIVSVTGEQELVVHERQIKAKDSDLSSRSTSTCCSSSQTQIAGNVAEFRRQPSIIESIKTIKSFSEGGNKNSRITNALVQFIYKDNMPFNTVEGEGFLKLMKEVCPLYKVPSRNSIKNYIDEKYDAVSASFSRTLSDVKNLTLTTDIWTDISVKSYLGITVHFLQDLKLVSACLDVVELDESHTADYISEVLLNTLKKWNISPDNIVAVVTDNGANIVKAIHKSFGKNRHVPCFAHTLNLVCDNAIKNTENLNELLEKVRAIVVWFKRSVKASDQLRKLQKEDGILDGNIKKLIMDVKTRWNSIFYMIQRFLEMAPLISKIVYDNVNAPEMVSALQLENLREVARLLSPIETVTKEISGEKYVTLSKIIPMIACLQNEYQNTTQTQYRCEISKSLKRELLKELDKRFGNIEKSFLSSISTMLDPRFKNIHFKDTTVASNIIKYLKTEIKTDESGADDSTDTESSSDTGTSFDLWSYHKQVAHTRKTRKGSIVKLDEVSQYLSLPVRTLKEDPLLAWEEMKSIFPRLHKLAEKYLPIVGTSVPCERLFSKAALTATKSRNRLNSKRLNKLLFLQSIPENQMY